MAIIRITAQEARECVKNNNAKLQVMYDVAPFSDEDPNPDARPVARGFADFQEYLMRKKVGVKDNILQT